MDKFNTRTVLGREPRRVVNRGEPWRFEKPWRGTARFVVRFAKKPNRAVAGRVAVRQDTNRTMAVRCGPCEPPRFVEPWSTLLQDNAFNQIKEACNQHLPISPINYDKLQDPNILYNLYLVTDASKVGVGSFLCHGKTFEEAKKNVAAILVHSRKFTPAQCNYSTTDQELLAIIDALRTFEHKLLGFKFIIVTDHMALRTLMTQTVRNQPRIRWLETITMFDFDIQHIQGSENILADALSRIYDGIKEEDLTREDYLQEE